MKIKTLFYTNKYHPFISNLVTSLTNYNYDYSFIGINDKWLGFGSKLQAVRKYVNTFIDKSYTHILVLDAFDVLILNDINEKYVSETDIIFSAETNCYPNPKLAELYPTTDTIYKYLNAGSWISPIKYIDELCNCSAYENDQLHFTELFLANTLPITLDYNCDLFQTLYGVNQNTIVLKDNKYNNTITNSSPCILHGNGKINMDKYINELNIK